MQRQGNRAYLLASIVAPIAALARNVILARILGVEAFGLAITLVITAQFFDTVTDSGSDKFIVQDAAGDTHAVQKLAQGTLVLRGIASGLAMAALAFPLAHFYNQPQIMSALMWLGVVPFLNGFVHLDMRRQQRRRDFRAESRMIIVAEIGSTIVAAASAWWLRDFHAVLLALIARALLMTLISHLTAERSYRLQYDSEAAKRMWAFGWPLLLNGSLLFFASQGDRLLISRDLGPQQLALYSTTLLLIFYPATMIQKFISGQFFPTIAAAQGSNAAILRAEEGLKGVLVLMAIVGLLSFAAAAPLLLVHVYGPAYWQPAELVAMVGLLQVTRMLRVWPATVAIGVGVTGNILAGNLIRLIALPLGAAGVGLGWGLHGVAIGYVAGEVIALACTLVMLSRTLGRPVLTGADAIVALLLAGGLVTSVAIAARSFDTRVVVIAIGCSLGLMLVVCRMSAIRYVIDYAVGFMSIVKGKAG